MGDFNQLIYGIEMMDIDESQMEIVDEEPEHDYGAAVKAFDLGKKLTLWNRTIPAMLASDPNFECGFIDIFERILRDRKNEKEQIQITEDVLNADTINILVSNYGNDLECATLKFNVLSHLLHIEECIRVINPLIVNQKPRAIAEVHGCQNIFKIEFEWANPATLLSPVVLFAETKILEGTGNFYSYEGRAVTGGRSIVIEFKPFPGKEVDPEDKFFVFEKPFETNFIAWQYMIKEFRNKRYLSPKVFGPIALDGQQDKFLEERAQYRDQLFEYNSHVLLNEEQKDAIYSMHRQDPRNTFVLFGPPGTGKTTTLVEAIRTIRKHFRSKPGQSNKPRFLVCTPSNSAADAFAIKLLERKVLPANLIFRAIASRYDTSGYDSRLDDVVRKRGDLFFLPDVKNELSSFEVIISTIGFCQAFKALSKSYFTHIIVDEAGQCLEPETFIPIAYYANDKTNVIIAGDPQQLGPVITSNFLCNERFGTSQSCLLRLATEEEYRTDQRLMVQLRNNHRSHEYIVNMVSYMFYDNTLRFTRPEGHDSLCFSPVLNKSEIPVRFVCVYGQEVDTAPSYYNDDEIAEVEKYVKLLFKEHKLEPKDVGIVCPYRENVRRMQDRFRRYKEMTVDTVEKFQGSERRVIIMTTVRTSGVGFLQEYRRFNTGITRAKHMLIVIGDPLCLGQDRLWRQFLYYLYRSNCIDYNTEDPGLLTRWNDLVALCDAENS